MISLPAILALDPGGTTGWCLFDPGVAPLRSTREIERGEIPYENHYKKLFDLLVSVSENRRVPPLHVVCERFEFRKSDQERDKINYISAEYIGVVKLFGQIFKASGIKVIWQGASQAKAFWSDDKLKQLGLWIPGQKHAMDATRHYLYYRVFTLGDKSVLYELKE